MYSFVISANSSPMYKKPNGFSFYRRRDFGVIQVAIGQHSLGTPVGQPLEEVAYCPRGIDPRPQLQNTARQVLVLFHQMLRRAFATTQLASGQIGGCAAYGSSSQGEAKQCPGIPIEDSAFSFVRFLAILPPFAYTIN